eukprot:1192538-Prorocentrum_minimum.AAC.3
MTAHSPESGSYIMFWISLQQLFPGGSPVDNHKHAQCPRHTQIFRRPTRGGAPIEGGWVAQRNLICVEALLATSASPRNPRSESIESTPFANKRGIQMEKRSVSETLNT